MILVVVNRLDEVDKDLEEVVPNALADVLESIGAPIYGVVVRSVPHLSAGPLLYAHRALIRAAKDFNEVRFSFDAAAGPVDLEPAVWDAQVLRRTVRVAHKLGDMTIVDAVESIERTNGHTAAADFIAMVERDAEDKRRRF